MRGGFWIVRIMMLGVCLMAAECWMDVKVPGTTKYPARRIHWNTVAMNLWGHGIWSTWTSMSVYEACLNESCPILMRARCTEPGGIWTTFWPYFAYSWLEKSYGNCSNSVKISINVSLDYFLLRLDFCDKGLIQGWGQTCIWPRNTDWLIEVPCFVFPMLWYIFLGKCSSYLYIFWAPTCWLWLWNQHAWCYPGPCIFLYLFLNI